MQAADGTGVVPAGDNTKRTHTLHLSGIYTHSVYMYMHTYECIHMFVCIYIYIQICMYVYIYIYICIYMYIDIHVKSLI
jgi:hypothetical protein